MTYVELRIDMIQQQTLMRNDIVKPEILALQPIKRIIKNASGLRVSDEAGYELACELEDVATTITRQAIKLAKHAGRKTVKREDIILATEQLTEE